MANAYKCDRCGALYEFRNDPDNPYTIATTHGLFGTVAKDLCPRCRESLNSWFTDPSTVVHHVVYEKPGVTLCDCPCNDKKRWWKK